MRKYRTIAYAGLACALCLAAKVQLQRRVSHGLTSNLNLPPLQATYHGHSLKQYSFGFDLVLSDLIWIDLLQRATNAKLAEGTVSWEYAQLDAITTLDPHFTHAYPFGTAYLSVFRRDKLGAKLLLERWVKRMPYYWRANYLLSYHLFYEMNDYATASKYMLRAAAQEHAPSWLVSLGIRLLSQGGTIAQALRMAIEIYPALTADAQRDRIQSRIRSLHFHFEQAQWESALEAYRSERKHEPHTIDDLISLRREKDRSLASLLTMQDVPEDIVPILTEKFEFRYDPKSRAIAAVGDTSDIGQLGVFHPSEK